MAKHRCPCCGWKIRLGAERADILAACSNCGQVVQVPGVPPCAIPTCNTESMIDWGKEGIPQENDWLPPLPTELCVPRRQEHSVWAYVIISLLCIGVSIFFVVLPGFPPSLGERLMFGAIGSLFFLAGVYLLCQGFHRLLRRSGVRLLSTAQLPCEANHLGTPLALHRNQGALPPALLILLGVFLVAGAVGCVFLVLLGEIEDMRMLLVALCGVALGTVAIQSALSYRPLLLLVYGDGFVVLHGQETGVLWRWDDIKSIRIEKCSRVPVLFSYTLHRKDGKRFDFDHRLEYIENQFGVRVQQTICRLLLPQLLSELRAGESVGFGPIRVSSEGLHHGEGLVPWRQVANLTLDSEQLTIRKWGDDYGANWSVPYPNIPNLAAFFALAQLILQECTNAGQSALSVLWSGSVDPTAIEVHSSDLQPPSQLTELP